MIERVLSILKNETGLTDFRINATKTESYELFFVHKTLETVRSTDTTDLKVTVFDTHNGKSGDSTFSVYASYDDETIRREIDAARRKAALIDNEPYPLPEGEKATIASDSNFAAFDMPTLAEGIALAAFAADTYAEGSINALEVFVYRDTVTVINSRGIEKTEIRYRAMLEAIPTWNGGAESVELYECYNFTEFDAAAITARIDSKMREVRDRDAATPPASKISAPVLLAAPELEQLFLELAHSLSYASTYNHTALFRRGDSVQKDPTGDRLTLTMRGRMKGSVRSAAFDSDGVTLLDTEIIRDGVAVGSFGSIRYASYLGEKPTGALACLEVEKGTLGSEELRRAPYFRVASMSGLQLDLYSDYIGGEVRLAYYFDGEREIPVTGISISGKLSECLSGMRLTDTLTVNERYHGPAFALFSGMEIV